MAVTILTKEDLQEFKTDVLNEIKRLFNTNEGGIKKQWLKSNEVRKLLNISAGTLQTLRINGILTYSKIGGIIYYKYEDIVKLLEKK